MLIPNWLMKVLSSAKINGIYCDTTCPFLSPQEGLCSMEKDGGNNPTVLEKGEEMMAHAYKRCSLCLEVEKISRGV